VAAAQPDLALSFEEAIQRLEEVVRQLENGDLNLEMALALFQEGVMLSRHCSGQLNAAEARIEKLLEENGSVTAVPLEAE